MDLKPLQSFFVYRLYRIPSYQRGYAWEAETQIKDLWKDIENINGTENHYTGLITLVESPSEKTESHDCWLTEQGYKQYYIVDGQQRLTSILILIKCIVDEAKRRNLQTIGIQTLEDVEKKYLVYELNTNRSFVFGYESDNPSYEFFKKYILGIHDSPTDEGTITFYTRNLENAKDYLGKKVQKIENLPNLFTKITSQLHFNEYIIDKMNPFVIFETMNNRGKPITELEKLKNRLMYLASKLPNLEHGVKEALESDISSVWKLVYEYLGKNSENPLSDDEFLKAHWIMYFDEYRRNEAKVYETYLFEKYFTIQNVYKRKITKQAISDYIVSLKKAVVAWNKIHNPGFFDATDAELKRPIESLHRVGFKASFKPILLASLMAWQPSDTIKLCKIIEDYSFKIFDIADCNSNTGDSNYYKLAYKLYSNTSLNDIFTSIKQHLNQNYIFGAFKIKVTKSLFDFGNKEGFYKWSGIHYFLYEYNEYLMKKNNVEDASVSLNWEQFSKDFASIEHIFPQNGISKDNPKWADFNNYSEEQRKRLCGSLGNLLALSKPKNSSLQDDSFEEKKDQSSKGSGYKNKGYKYGSYSERLVANNTDWTPHSILDRGIDMIDFLLLKLEETNSPTKKEKAELLGIDFLLQNEASTVTLDT